MRSGLLFATAVAVVLAVAPAHALVEISAKKTRNMSCVDGVCSATAQDAVLNVNALANMLASADVTVRSTSSSNNIAIYAALSWIGATRLTLDSYHGIALRQPVVVQGPGALTLTTNDGGSGGDLQFLSGATAGFWDLGSSLIVNGTAYTLVPDVKTLAGAAQADPAGSFALAADYDAAPDGVYSASPIDIRFRGSFEGLGHTIRNLSIIDTSKREASTALFKRTGRNAFIRDLSLQAVNVSGGHNGLLAALVAENYGAILHVRVQGQVTGIAHTEIIGGVAAQNYGRLRDASFDGDIKGSTTTGGLVGWNYMQGSIDSSRTSGTIENVYIKPTGNLFVGGLVGFNGTILGGSDRGIITASRSSMSVSSNIAATSIGGLVGGTVGFIWKSSASGSVSMTGELGSAGGFAGLNGGVTQWCYAQGTVFAGNHVAAGGFAGNDEAGDIEDSYATGAVQAGSSGYAGGFVGETLANGSVETSYSTGSVTASETDLGGFIGFDSNGLALTYWDLDTSGISDPSKGAGNIANDPGVAGLTDSQLKSALPSGFDKKVWGQRPSINNGYPYLIANPPPQ